MQAEATRTGSITANGGDGSSVIKFKAAQDVKVDADGALDASGGIIYMCVVCYQLLIVPTCENGVSCRQATGGNVDMLATNDISVVANNNLDGRVILESLQDTNVGGQWIGVTV